MRELFDHYGQTWVFDYYGSSTLNLQPETQVKGAAGSVAGTAQGKVRECAQQLAALF